jgi:UDP-2,3-diacylglucosamine pyrophosphatase LpxH
MDYVKQRKGKGMRTHAVKGLIECHKHHTYIIKCHCPVETTENVRTRLKKLGIEIEPAKEPWLATSK